MWVNSQKEYVFVSTPKSGTNTMYDILKAQGGRKYGQPPGVEPKSTLHRNVLDPSWNDYYKFTVVRNPFSRAVAAWWHLIVKKDEGGAKRRGFQISMNKAMGGDSFQHFTAFLLFRHDVPDRAIMFDSQHEWHNNIQFDKVLKLEDLQTGLNDIPLLDGASVANKQKNSFVKERKKPWKDYYTAADVENVVKGWNDDFTQFDYPTTLDI
jgi:hypothetical protein